MTRLTLAVLCTLLLAAACRAEPATETAVEQERSVAVQTKRQETPEATPQRQRQEVPEATPQQQPQETPEATPQQQRQVDVANAEVEPPAGNVERIDVVSPERGVLKVTWQAVKPTPTEYWVSWARIERKFPAPTSFVGNAFVTENSHTITGLIPGARYKVRVRTRYGDQSDPDSISLGTWSRVNTARIIDPPFAPTGFRAVATHRGVILEWNRPRDDNISLYLLVRELRNTAVQKNIRIDGTETTFLDSDTEPDTRYDYVLHGINQDGQSPQSNTVSVNTLALLPGRGYLYERIQPPMAPAHARWDWEPGANRLRELIVDFTIHNDPGDWSDRNGYFLILMSSNVSGVPFYFGLQTDIDGVKGGVFSRWDTRDLTLARFDRDEGWTESSGHEGDFIGVRRIYRWTEGNYRARIAPDGKDADGEWFSVWLTNLDSNATTWMGSLKFPFHAGSATMQPTAPVTIELYGSVIRPIDIPVWHVSVDRAIGDGAPAVRVATSYPHDASDNALPNSNVHYDPEQDKVHLVIGGVTLREDPAERYALE